MGAARNVVPWKEMERRVAARIAAKAGHGEKAFLPAWKNKPEQLDDDDNESGPKQRHIASPPASGVRASQPDEIAELLQASELARPMSFTVYKLEDLDARARASVPVAAPAPEPERWPEVWRSFKGLFQAYWASRSVKPRPRLKDAMSVAFAIFKADLTAALRVAPWKRIALYSGASLVTFMFLLFAVVTVADLTDDLKPAAPGESFVTNALVAPKAASVPLAPSVEPAAATDEAAAAPAEIELDDTPAAHTTPAKKKQHTKKKKKAAAEPFTP